MVISSFFLRLSRNAVLPLILHAPMTHKLNDLMLQKLISCLHDVLVGHVLWKNDTAVIDPGGVDVTHRKYVDADETLRFEYYFRPAAKYCCLVPAANGLYDGHTVCRHTLVVELLNHKI